MHRIYLALLSVLISCMLAGCGGKQEKRLIFHAGAGQRSSLDECAEVFCKANPDIKVDFCYKGSGYFMSDIGISKEGDLYMPGEEFYMLQAAEKGHIKDYNPKKDVSAYFVTVIITPAGNPKNIKSIEDFAKEGVRVGIGDENACAIGKWHEKIFKKAGIWDKVRKNAVMNAKCIPELGNACQLKAIDAAIVWGTTAVLYLNDVDIVPIQTEYRGLVRLPVGLVTYTKHPAEALKLKDFILSPEGKEIFHKHAYVIEPDPVDKDGFCLEGKNTDIDMKWLVEAVKACRDKSMRVNKDTVGPLVEEVERQRERRK